MSEKNIVTEIIKLPSQGLVYSKESELAKGEVEMKYMTAKDEDILTNKSYIEKGIVIDKLLQSLIVSDINYDEIIEGDKDALLIAARILGYGKIYDFEYVDPKSKEKVKTQFDLTEIKDKELDKSLFKNENNFEFTSSITKNVINFKFLTHGDSKKIDAEVRGLQKIQPNGSYESSTRMKHIITGINGKTDIASIREYVDKYMLASEARELRKYIAKIQPGIDMKYYPEGTEEGIDIPMTVSFLWPDFGA